jgi:hypothetical protein
LRRNEFSEKAAAERPSAAVFAQAILRVHPSWRAFFNDLTPPCPIAT